MAENFDDFIERVRDANPIEDVLEESGIHLRGHGRMRTATKHDSLKVRTDFQRAWWYSQNWNGDVFGWVMKEKGIEFFDALEILARRANIDMPKTAKVNESEVKRNRATTDVFSAAADVFHRWLGGDAEKGIEADAPALEYAKGRGWSDETLNLAMVGFSGRKTARQMKDMRGEFDLYGIDPLCPAAVSIFGFEGDVEGWSVKYDMLDEVRAEGWIEKGRIHGLMDTPGLIYAHQHRGGVNYLSRRQLPGFDSIKDRETKKQRDWKSFNPHKVLVGPKQAYWNHSHRTDRPLVCVEGQGDAVTFGQWGQGSMAFCGLLGDPGQMAPEDGERMRRLASKINKHPAVYLSLDDDEAGAKGLYLAAKLLGPKIQILRMSKQWSREDARTSSAAEREEVLNG
jgi:DNA primase